MIAISLFIFSHNATFRAVDYNMRKVHSGDAELLRKANFDALASIENPSASDYKNYLLVVTRSNKDLLCRQFHATIGITEKSISTQSLAEIAERWLWKMGYKSQPYLIFSHNDTPNAHVHIVSSRITSAGKLIPPMFEVRRGREAMNRILGIDLDANTKQAFDEAMSYQFKDIKQFKLLLKTMGFHLTRKQGALHLYFQDVLRLAVPQEHVLERASCYCPDNARLNEIRALFDTSKSSASPALYELNSYFWGRVSSKFTGWHSKMVQLLEQQLDIKIIFENRHGELPHDYMVIDRKTKHIYEGAQLMPLAEFTKERPYIEKIDQLKQSELARSQTPASSGQQTEWQTEGAITRLSPAEQRDPER